MFDADAESITTVSPPAAARAAASSLEMPSCNQRALAPIFTASSAMAGVASALRKTSTMSTFSGMASSEG